LKNNSFHMNWEYYIGLFMFQFNSKTVCLTYSNVGQQQQQHLPDSRGESLLPPSPFLSNATLLSAIRLRDHGGRIQFICVARESHKDGSIHYHVGYELSKPLRTRDERFWDLDGVHPNVQPARQFRAWIKYIRKDGDYLEEGFLNENKPGPEQIIEQASQMDRLEFLAWMSANKFQYASTIWEMAHPDLTHTIMPDDIIGTLDRVDPSIIRHFITMTWEQSKVLILWGETGLGKTSMAKILVPKPALMVSHLDDLKKFRSGYHKGIIFDDVSIRHIPETGQIHLLDYNDTRSIHVRYGTVLIPKNTPKIFTCNEFPVSDIPAIQRRIVHIKCSKFY